MLSNSFHDQLTIRWLFNLCGLETSLKYIKVKKTHPPVLTSPHVKTAWIIRLSIDHLRSLALRFTFAEILWMMALPLADTMKGERPSCHLLPRDTWSATDLKVGLHLTGSVTKAGLLFVQQSCLSAYMWVTWVWHISTTDKYLLVFICTKLLIPKLWRQPINLFGVTAVI